MKREIKFRSYNPETKKMFYDFDQQIKEVGLGKSIHQFIYETGLCFDTLMQFTGLKDKNGKEIYEGDIIKWKTTRWHTEEQRIKGVAMPKFFISPVLWHQGGFLVNESDDVDLNAEDHDTPLCCFFMDSMDNKFDFKAEIIGNIYQNPELITNK